MQPILDLLHIHLFIELSWKSNISYLATCPIKKLRTECSYWLNPSRWEKIVKESVGSRENSSWNLQ